MTVYKNQIEWYESCFDQHIESTQILLLTVTWLYICHMILAHIADITSASTVQYSNDQQNMVLQYR